MERLGFFVCDSDLEDELIRALGTDAVERVVDARGVLGPLRTFQKQPEWRDRPVEEQLRRFLGTAAAARSATRALVDALDSRPGSARSSSSSHTSERLHLDRRLRFAQVLVDEGDRHPAFADARRHALDRAGAHIAAGEDPGGGGLER